MKRFIFVILFLIINLSVSAAEYIDSFNAEIVVNPDATLTGTETITVYPEHNRIKRGIFRDLPVGNGEVYEVLSILKDGLPEPFMRKTDKYMTRLQIGSANKMLPVGQPATYVIRYKAKYTGLKRHQTYEEVYWNVTGQWQIPIYQASAKVVLPAGAEFIQQSSYRGSAGSKQNASFIGENTFTTGLLKVGQQLTIAIGFTPNIIAQPVVNKPTPKHDTLGGPLAPVKFFFMRNFTTDFSYETDVSNAIIMLGGLFLYFLIAWFWRGRDIYFKTPMVEYDMPDNVTPELCSIWKQGGCAVNDDLMNIHLIRMVQNGFLKIHSEQYPDRKEPVYFVTKISEPKTSAEKEYDKLMPKVLVLDGEYNEDFSDYVEEYCCKEEEKYAQECKTNGKWVLGAFLVLAGLLFCTPRPIIATIITVLALMFIWLFSISARALQIILTIIFAIVLGFNIMNYVKADKNIIQGGFFFQAIVLWFMSVIAAPIFSKLMEQPTKSGSVKFAKIQGLEMFLKAVNIKTPADFTREKAEKLYPYALALELADNWEKRFKNFIGQTTIDPTVYNRNFVKGFKSETIKTTISPRSGSGSSGGGSSGGGGGGGGGGGW